MAMVEQNISGVKLEKLRQKANKKTKFMRRMPIIVFIICLLLSMLKPRNIGLFFIFTSGEDIDIGNIGIGILMLFGEVMLAFCMAALAFAIYMLLFWKKSYNLFNDNYKNKYVLQKMREVRGFSNLRYVPKHGITFLELEKANLLPGRAKSFFESKDYFEGTYDMIRFWSSNVETFENNDSAMAVFSGQVIVFSMFHEFKISQTAIQIFPKKENKKMKGLTFPIKIETENESFHNMFSVFAEEEHNAFYILTPQVIEDIMEFAQMINENIYIVFIGQYMYVGCEQMRNPFDALVDVPLEDQTQNIVKATDLIQKARDILIHIEKQSHAEKAN